MNSADVTMKHIPILKNRLRRGLRSEKSDENGNYGKISVIIRFLFRKLFGRIEKIAIFADDNTAVESEEFFSLVPSLCHISTLITSYHDNFFQNYIIYEEA